jgi:ribonuclease HII
MRRICGIDEAGRGPLAGPVTAAAVLFGRSGPGCTPADSKTLSAGRRGQLEQTIRRTCDAWGIGWVWPHEIDRINIHHASLLAMQRAFESLCGQLRHNARDAEAVIAGIEILVDGAFTPRFDLPCRAVVGGDGSVPQISAASILAKEARDRWMRAYHREEPQYGFDRHVGYPTAFHRKMIQVHGVSKIHRHSFSATRFKAAQTGVTPSS